jgi:adenosylcobinamide-phosphate synthase
MAWDALLLYACLGWRGFSQHFMAIRNALAESDEELARRLLAAWQGVETARVPATEIARHAIEYAVLSAHRHVFGVVAWYGFSAMLGLAPLGAVMYRLAEVAMRDFRLRHTVLALSERSLLAEVAERAWQVLDWVPARLTALSFAMVGNFVEAVGSWRAHDQQAPMDSDGLLLAAMAGALNIRLGGQSLARLAPPEAARDAATGGAAWSASEVILTPQLTAQPGAPRRREPEVPRMGEVAGLLWRSLGVWLLMLVLLTLARLL